VSRPARSNPLALAVLVCLMEAPMHPYEIGQTLKSRAKEESVRLNFGSLYGVVESLEKRGMIRAKETVRAGRRPERTIYEVTDDGAREATDWLADLLTFPAKEFPAFMAALSFLPALTPDEAAMALHRRVSALELQLMKMRSVGRAAEGAGLPRLFGIESEYEAHMLEAELDFVRKLAEEIDTGTLDGIRLWHAFHSDPEEQAALMAELDFSFPGAPREVPR
jgi:DNA-binding PadR family transcriptional regulator